MCRRAWSGAPRAAQSLRRAALQGDDGARARRQGVLVVTGPNSPNAGELLPLTNDGTNAGSGIVAASISGDSRGCASRAERQNLERSADRARHENPHAEGGFVLPKVKVKLACRHRAFEENGSQRRRLPAAGRVASDEYVLVGAHYDHLGRRRQQFARADRRGKQGPSRRGRQRFRHGRGDGTGGIAREGAHRASGEIPARRHLRLLVGRRDRADRFRRLLRKAAGADGEDRRLSSTSTWSAACATTSSPCKGVGSSQAWRKLIEKRNVAAGFNLALQDDPYLPTDMTSFYPKHVPVLNFFTGAHEDYHRPTDTADKLNYDGLERIAKFAQQIVLDLAQTPERPDFAKVERSGQDGGGRETLRAYLGTIPDYTTEVKGVKLSGVRGAARRKRAGSRRRRDRRICRPEDREHLRLHLRARCGENRPAGKDRRGARRQAVHADRHPGSAEVIWRRPALGPLGSTVVCFAGRSSRPEGRPAPARASHDLRIPVRSLTGLSATKARACGPQQSGPRINRQSGTAKMAPATVATR